MNWAAPGITPDGKHSNAKRFLFLEKPDMETLYNLVVQRLFLFKL